MECYGYGVGSEWGGVYCLGVENKSGGGLMVL